MWLSDVKKIRKFNYPVTFLVQVNYFVRLYNILYLLNMSLYYIALASFITKSIIVLNYV